MLKVTVCVLGMEAKMAVLEPESLVADALEVLDYDLEELEEMDMTINGRPATGGIDEVLLDNDVVLFMPRIEGGSK